MEILILAHGWPCDIHTLWSFHLHSVLLVCRKAMLFLLMVVLGISTVNWILVFIKFSDCEKPQHCFSWCTHLNLHNSYLIHIWGNPLPSGIRVLHGISSQRDYHRTCNARSWGKIISNFTRQTKVVLLLRRRFDFFCILLNTKKKTSKMYW